MSEAKVKELRAEANRGIEEVRRGHADRASLCFNNALGLAEDLEDERTRRDELASLSLLFERCGFPDLALMAAEGAVELDRRLQLESLMGQDIISVGNAHFRLRNVAKAEACYREAVEFFVKRGEWANAASANTNLAGIVSDRGEIKKAIAMFETSLDYLARQPFADTEKNTRFVLMQAMEFEGYSVDRAVDNARWLCSRFWKELREDQQRLAKDFVGRCVQRYLEAHPQPDPAAWKAATFPMLYR